MNHASLNAASPDGNAGNALGTGNLGGAGSTDGTGNPGGAGSTDGTGNPGGAGSTDGTGNLDRAGGTDGTGNLGSAGSTSGTGDLGSAGSPDGTGKFGGAGSTDGTGDLGSAGSTSGGTGNLGVAGSTDGTGNPGSTGSTGGTGTLGSAGSTGGTGNLGGAGSPDCTGSTSSTSGTGNPGGAGSPDGIGNTKSVESPPPPALLTLRNLSVDFNGLKAVERVDLSVAPGEVLGIVGESGSGKSVTMLALMGLIDAPGKVSADEIRFDGHDLLHASAHARRRIIGNEIAMVFQDALTSLNPSYTVGYQIREVLRLHERLRGAALKKRALELLDQVGIPDAKNRIDSFPHQLSGGMNQRVMIAMAIACNPKLLIADEPTTALDVTIQAQIMDLLVHLQKARGMALVLISHDLAVVSEVAQRVAVMYAGEIIETNRVPDIFAQPHHPYTEALLAAIPERNAGAARLAALPGMVPGRDDRPPGCLFAPRCAYADDACAQKRPELAWPGVGDADDADAGDAGDAGDIGDGDISDISGGTSDAGGISDGDISDISSGGTSDAGDISGISDGAGGAGDIGDGDISDISSGGASDAGDISGISGISGGAGGAGDIGDGDISDISSGGTSDAGDISGISGGVGGAGDISNNMSGNTSSNMGGDASGRTSGNAGNANASASGRCRVHRHQGHCQVRCIKPLNSLNSAAPTPTAGEVR